MPKLYVKPEARKRKMKLRVMNELADFIGVVAGIAVIIAALILLSALISWIATEGLTDTRALIDLFTDALIIPD